MSNIVSIFAEYGWPGILVVVLVGIVWYLLKRSRKEFKEDITSGIHNIADTVTDSMSKQNEILIQTLNQQNNKLIDFLVKDKSEAKHTHDTMMSERMELSNDINNKIKDIMNINNADRVMIVEFHNSYKNMSGIPFAKYSVTYETTRRGSGLLPYENTLANMPFSSISGILKAIYDNGGWQVVFHDIDDIEEYSSTIYTRLENINAKGIIYNAMYDDNAQMIGLLILEYHKEIPSHVNYKELMIDAAQITSIINLRYKYNKK